MDNKKYWDDLFEQINSMSREEFERMAFDLDETDEIPFAIYEEEVQALLCNYINDVEFDFDNYTISSKFKGNTEASYFVPSKYDECLDYEAA